MGIQELQGHKCEGQLTSFTTEPSRYRENRSITTDKKKQRRKYENIEVPVRKTRNKHEANTGTRQSNKVSPYIDSPPSFNAECRDKSRQITMSAILTHLYTQIHTNILPSQHITISLLLLEICGSMANKYK